MLCAYRWRVGSIRIDDAEPCGGILERGAASDTEFVTLFEQPFPDELSVMAVVFMHTESKKGSLHEVRRAQAVLVLAVLDASWPSRLIRSNRLMCAHQEKRVRRNMRSDRVPRKRK